MKGRRLLAALLLAAMVLGLSACKNEEKAAATVAVVTDGGALMDSGYNQAVYQGVQAWCEASGCTLQSYEPKGTTVQAIEDSMEQAYQDGAKVIVVAGSAFEQAVYEMQTAHSSLQFLLLDGEPHDIDYNYQTAGNVHCVLFREEEAGFLAGYAAVMEGYRQLGFIGGVQLTGVIQYCYGFLQGADLAASDLGLEEEAVKFKYTYSGSFEESSSVEETAAKWYKKGTKLIFSACGEGRESVLNAAQAGGGSVVLSDFGYEARSEQVFTIAQKKFDKAIELALTKLKKNGWTWVDADSGQTETVGLAEECVGLPATEESWPFAGFPYEEYCQLVQDIEDSYVSISEEIGAAPSTKIVSVMAS